MFGIVTRAISKGRKFVVCFPNDKNKEDGVNAQFFTFGKTGILKRPTTA